MKAYIYTVRSVTQFTLHFMDHPPVTRNPDPDPANLTAVNPDPDPVQNFESGTPLMHRDA